MRTANPRLVLTAVLLLGSACGTAPALQQQASSAVDPLEGVLRYGGHAILYRLRADLIGVGLAAGVEPGALDAVATEFGLKVAGVAGPVTVLQAPIPMPRHELWASGRRFRERMEGLVVEAGPIFVSDRGWTTMVGEEIGLRFTPESTLDGRRRIEDELRALGWKGAIDLESTRNQWISLRDQPPVDVLQLCERLWRIGGEQSETLVFVEPSLAVSVEARDFADQWHLENSGQTSGTVDADIDASKAWKLLPGSPKVTVAVIDDGFLVDHEDFPNNVVAKNFTSNPPSNTVDVKAHGTQVAGTIAALHDNGKGGSGVAPGVSLLLLQHVVKYSKPKPTAQCFEYAEKQKADVIACAWGYNAGEVPVPGDVKAAIEDAISSGCVVLFAFPNSGGNLENFSFTDVAQLPSVIGVASSTHTDQGERTSFAKELDLLAPSRNACVGFPFVDGIYTTHANPQQQTAKALYTDSFGGNSAAVSVAAGVAALVRRCVADLEPRAVRFLLEDTADRIEPSAARYDPRVGRRTVGNTHGFGRVNAFEAVRVVSPKGHSGVDVFLRDNHLDWGNTEVPSSIRLERFRHEQPFWESPDIKVDLDADGPTPANSLEFDELVSEAMQAGSKHRIHVRVRNRGPFDADASTFELAAGSHPVHVGLAWSLGGMATAPLPSDFWQKFPQPSSSTSEWSLLPTQQISVPSRVSTSGDATAHDATAIVSFDLTLPGQTIAWHTTPASLLAIVSAPPRDGLPELVGVTSAAAVVPWQNNVSLRNVPAYLSFFPSPKWYELDLENPLSGATAYVFRIDGLPESTIATDGFAFGDKILLQPGERRRVRIQFDPELDWKGSARLTQWALEPSPHRVGSLIFRRDRERPKTERE